MSTPDEPSRSTPWLSLLLPVYNVEAYVEACVASILDQQIDGIEVLLLDDASTDGSADCLRRIAARHGDVVRTLAHARNGGLSAARNTLLGEARGEHAWFVDSDDILFPGALAGLRRVVERFAPDLVLCDFGMVREDFRLKHRLRGERHRATFRGPARRPVTDPSELARGLLTAGQLHAWSKIARRDVWRAAPFPVGRYYEDIAVIAPLLAATRSAVHVPEAWIGYRQRAGSIMSAQTCARQCDLAASLRDLHTGLVALDPPLSRHARFALDYFCLKTYASVARRSSHAAGGDADRLRSACLDEIRRLFPEGVATPLRALRRRGWFARAWRVRRSLARAGWLR